jgi:hypothetical protein
MSLHLWMGSLGRMKGGYQTRDETGDDYCYEVFEDRDSNNTSSESKCQLSVHLQTSTYAVKVNAIKTSIRRHFAPAIRPPKRETPIFELATHCFQL